jgi:hypothetical protein
LGAWSYTSNIEKILRLEEHIRYAAQFGDLSLVDAFLRALPESEWLHFGGA